MLIRNGDGLIWKLTSSKTDMIMASMEPHTWNPSIQEAEAVGWKIESSLGYIVRPCLKKRQKTC
jgi:hypothetical protein